MLRNFVVFGADFLAFVVDLETPGHMWTVTYHQVGSSVDDSAGELCYVATILPAESLHLERNMQYIA